MKTYIAVDLNKCTGCRACVMACSFHFSKNFSPKNSAIRVLRDNKNGEISVTISSICDSCENEKGRFCQMFCEPGAIKILKSDE